MSCTSWMSWKRINQQQVLICGWTIPLRFKTLQIRSRSLSHRVQCVVLVLFIVWCQSPAGRWADKALISDQPPLFYSAAFKHKHQTGHCSLWSTALRASYTVCACLFVHRRVCMCITPLKAIFHKEQQLHSLLLQSLMLSFLEETCLHLNSALQRQ